MSARWLSRRCWPSSGGVGDLAGDHADGADGVVVRGDHVVHFVGVAVGINHGDDRYAQLDGFGDGDALAVRVYDKDRVGQVAHLFDATEQAVQAVDLLFELTGLGLRQSRELATAAARFEVGQVAQAVCVSC